MEMDLQHKFYNFILELSRLFDILMSAGRLQGKDSPSDKLKKFQENGCCRTKESRHLVKGKF